MITNGTDDNHLFMINRCKYKQSIINRIFLSPKNIIYTILNLYKRKTIADLLEAEPEW
jgi:hypothetical protein